MGHSKSNPEREVHSTIGLPQEARKISDIQPNTALKRTRKTTTNKSLNKQKEGDNQGQSRNQQNRN